MLTIFVVSSGLTNRAKNNNLTVKDNTMLFFVTFASSGILRAVTRREQPVKTPISRVLVGLIRFKRKARNWEESGGGPIIPLQFNTTITPK